MIISLFIDQPIGVGYSFGNTTVGTSQQAAKDVWTVSTLFGSELNHESLYSSRDFQVPSSLV